MTGNLTRMFLDMEYTGLRWLEDESIQAEQAAFEDNAFGRKVRKYNSTLAGEASAAFSLALGQVATFDCRIVPLPTIERVRDYFLWRQEDARRKLRKQSEIEFMLSMNYL